MRCWRLTRRAHAALDGEGSRLFGGRWSPPGIPVVYTSGTASLAVLEYFVHLTPAQAPEDLVLIRIEMPDELGVAVVDPGGLPADWREYPAPDALARVGAAWVRGQSTVALQVPSAIVPHESNYLLNPEHAKFGRVVAGRPQAFSLDPRFWKASVPGGKAKGRAK